MSRIDPEMRSFTSRDLQKRPAEIQEAALMEPIAITHHGRARHVMMSITEFERMKRASEPKVYRLNQIPDDLLADLVCAEMDARHSQFDSLTED